MKIYGMTEHERQRNVLERIHPDARELDGSPEFLNWCVELRNADHPLLLNLQPDKAVDWVFIIDKFKADMAAKKTE